MDWFERLSGFREDGYEATRRRLHVEGQTLTSRVNGRSHGVGEFELVSLATLRERVRSVAGVPGALTLCIVRGDVRAMHQMPGYAGALFQVASQFNMLEMASYEVTPEDGVGRYEHDRTQGPACAIAAGAATIYRNYFVPVGDGCGQTRERQLDGLSDIGAALAHATGRPVRELWHMRNGYALCSATGLAAVAEHLKASSADANNTLRSLLRIGVHRDVQVTDGDAAPGQTLSQAFCSALPVAYTQLPAPLWQPFAQLVLEAAYEATLCAALLNARRGASKTVLLTRLGGGVFGNDDRWIDAALHRALAMFSGHDLEVRLVCRGEPLASMRALELAFRQQRASGP